MAMAMRWAGLVARMLVLGVHTKFLWVNLKE